MSEIKGMLSEMNSGSRTGLIVGVIVIIALAAYLSFTLIVKDYDILFQDLEDAEAANVVNGLKELKVDYRLADQGRTVLVEKDQVSEARLSLMSQGVLLNNTVGLEIFDNTDYGMTEFAQKVNFQRAMQGEIARTVMAFEEVKFARVHLTLPKDSIFADQQKAAKASITIIKEPGEFLSANQILGIQRLVASSVESLPVENVVVVDEKGLDISVKSVAESNQDENFAGTTILSKKREYERHLQQKVEKLLHKGLGKDQFALTIDVEIDVAKTTLVSENLVTPRDGANGYLKRENVNVRYGEQSVQKGSTNRAKTSEETNNEYMYGKEVKQTEHLAGGIKSVSVAVLLAASVDKSQIAAITQIVSAAVGINAERGDSIQVHKLATSAIATSSMSKEIVTETVPSPTKFSVTGSSIPQIAQSQSPIVLDDKTKMIMAAALGALLLLLAVFLVLHRRKQKVAREKVLADISGWLNDSTAAIGQNVEMAKNNA